MVNDPTRDYFEEHYMSLVEIKDFNTLIGNKPFFNQPVKSKKERYEKPTKVLRNNDYTTGYFLGYFYPKNYCKLIGKDLSILKNMSIL